jgi:hypothetical protein
MKEINKMLYLQDHINKQQISAWDLYINIKSNNTVGLLNVNSAL